MQQALGAEGYKKALESDVVANTTVQNAGQQREIERPAAGGRFDSLCNGQPRH